MYKELTTQEVIQYLKNFKFTRKLIQWHIHHTWIPDYSNFTGDNHQQLQANMEYYHINTNKWSCIGQHFTLFPDGVWLLGRDLNRDPASILGWNTGAIAVEMVGNFDKGHDIMTEKQKIAIYEVTEFAVEQMNLVAKFHRDNPTSYKTCPGSGIDRDVFFKEFINFTENKLLVEAKQKEDERKRLEIEQAKQKSERIKKILSEVRVEFSDLFDKESEKVHWANDYINFCKDRKILNGIKNSDGTFRFDPDRNMTRAELATVVAKTIESVEEKIYLKIDEAINKIKNVK